MAPNCQIEPGNKLSKAEIERLVLLDTLCFPADEAYDYSMMRGFLKEKGSRLIRLYEKQELLAFLLFNICRGEIITVDVHPEYQRQGLGRNLFQSALNSLKAAGVNRIYSQIRTNNVPSLMLHLRFGFKIRHVIRNYYGFGKNAYLLVRESNKADNSAK